MKILFCFFLLIPTLAYSKAATAADPEPVTFENTGVYQYSPSVRGRERSNDDGATAKIKISDNTRVLENNELQHFNLLLHPPESNYIVAYELYRAPRMNTEYSLAVRCIDCQGKTTTGIHANHRYELNLKQETPGPEPKPEWLIARFGGRGGYTGAPHPPRRGKRITSFGGWGPSPSGFTVYPIVFSGDFPQLIFKGEIPGVDFTVSSAKD